MNRRTRIVATLGPATDPPGVLESLLDAGLDVARINFSHGTAEEHLARVARFRKAAARLQRSVAVVADLPGPKLRAVLPEPLALEPGWDVSFAANPAVSAEIHLTEAEPIADVREGQRVLLDDGRLQLRVLRGDAEHFVAKVEVGGTLLPNKGINLPDTRLSIPEVTARDREALQIAAEAGVDWLALSFVRSPEAAASLREAAGQLGLDVPILAKMERPEAVRHAAEIIDAFDGVMVARGDLGVELPLEQVPHIQKRLINLARTAGKPVVTATDMLDSMRQNPRPTRAEASDVANAIYDGSDAVMLSGETAVGQYPREALAAMDRIVRETEAHLGEDDDRPAIHVPRGTIVDHITHAACDLARAVEARAIVTPTLSGRTPRLIARHRPRADIIAPVVAPEVQRRLALVWGVQPVPLDAGLERGDDRLAAAIRAAFVHRALDEGDLAVVLAGHPVEGSEGTPTVRVVRVGVGGKSCSPD